jgi:hypothetical protein
VRILSASGAERDATVFLEMPGVQAVVADDAAPKTGARGVGEPYEAASHGAVAKRLSPLECNDPHIVFLFFSIGTSGKTDERFYERHYRCLHLLALQNILHVAVFTHGS